MTDLTSMELGQVIDFVIEYNDLHNVRGEKDPKKKEDQPTVRKATQADWDAFWG